MVNYKHFPFGNKAEPAREPSPKLGVSQLSLKLNDQGGTTD